MHQKVRGHKRRWKAISSWVERNKDLDLIYVQKHGRDYVKFRLHPWGSLNLGKSKTSPPKHKTRKLIIDGLLDIYISWKKSLDSLGQPYYLKIWLYEPHLPQSQIVCAIGDYISYYDNVFPLAQNQKEFPNSNYQSHINSFKHFSWSLGIDEYFIEDFRSQPNFFKNDIIYLQEKKWLESQLDKPHRTIGNNAPFTYAFPQGNVWIGELKKENENT